MHQYTKCVQLRDKTSKKEQEAFGQDKSPWAEQGRSLAEPKALMGCRRQQQLWAGGYRGQIGEAVDVGKQSLRQHLGGCKLANSKFGEAKKRILLQEEGDVMKEQVRVPASGKAVSLWG